ncbi:hypothetical protein [Pseudomonas fontis]|uniref:Uncharacterized protein n=2 Tax=Pseudomonas fontis TaxID=2942633 RepID=A0ABT5NKI1_9PSED|nr:hypothetical protein [Pseudomonas fontis]MDD0976193.1 hypothetical protein [Pseudomonas fontis]MDD0989044.1 hypothetical protein [Pseudomonas fontis]
MMHLLAVLTLLTATATAAPSESEKESIRNIVDSSGPMLGMLLECDALPLYAQYTAALSDAMHAYPGTDPAKVRALLRKIERQAEVLGSLGMKRIPNPTPEEIENHQELCQLHARMATNSLQKLDDFILK